jgi:hypothetical protein
MEMRDPDQPNHELAAAWLAWHLVARLANETGNKPQAAELAAQEILAIDDVPLINATKILHQQLQQSLREAITLSRTKKITDAVQSLFKPATPVPLISYSAADIWGNNACSHFLREPPELICREIRQALRAHQRPRLSS